MKRNLDATCWNCPYYFKSDPDKQGGMCRRRSPKYTEGRPDDSEEDWVYMDDDEWCGEHPDFEAKAPKAADRGRWSPEEIDELNTKMGFDPLGS